MLANPSTSFIDANDLTNEITWKNLSLTLSSFVRSLVYSFGVPCWKGQEEDIVEDILQETARRILEHSRKAERGEATPIHALKPMMTTIAQNYCRDLRRHDRRLFRMQPYDDPQPCHSERSEGSLFDAISESVDQELLLRQVAHEIANFPEKQRRALLIDLASRMSFDGQPTPLQKAFLEVGVQLEHYRQPLPVNQQERSKHLSLLNHAYKRVTHLPCVQEYLS